MTGIILNAENRGTEIRMPANFSSEIMQSREQWNITFKIQGKLSTQGKNKAEMKTFKEIQKLKEFITRSTYTIKNIKITLSSMRKIILDENQI